MGILPWRSQKKVVMLLKRQKAMAWKKFLMNKKLNTLRRQYFSTILLLFAMLMLLYRLFTSMDDISSIFLGGLVNLGTLNKNYGLTKLPNEPMFVIQAYKTLHVYGSYSAHSFFKELEGSFGLLLYDLKAKTTFPSLVSLLLIR